MPEQLITALIIILGLALLWIILKAVLKLTLKVFSCGLILLLVIGALVYAADYFQLF